MFILLNSVIKFMFHQCVNVLFQSVFCFMPQQPTIKRRGTACEADPIQMHSDVLPLHSVGLWTGFLPMLHSVLCSVKIKLKHQTDLNLPSLIIEDLFFFFFS